MTTDDLKHLYIRDRATGCRHWHGPVKVRYHGKTWYPHILLWYLINHTAIPTNKVLVRTCDSEDCISPEHRTLQSRDYAIAQYRYTAAHK